MNEKVRGSVFALLLALFSLAIGGPGGTWIAGIFGLASAGLFLTGMLENDGL
jgi:hypothetical protein